MNKIKMHMGMKKQPHNSGLKKQWSCVTSLNYTGRINNGHKSVTSPTFEIQILLVGQLAVQSFCG